MDLELSTSSSDVKKAVTVSGSLAPGFRFHPTDEELVRYYLTRKIASKPFRFDAISDIDIYKAEPWDLPRLSKLKSRDLEWYFFSGLDNKYSNGSKTNRATEKGYWKTTGKDRPVYHRTKIVGMKKTLVYHSGRAPKGARSNWVMHEYRLVDEELEKAGIRPRDAAVLCRVFQKSGTGPKNGEQYGAPLIEDDWENDDLTMVPGEVAMGEVAFADDFYLDSDELDQILETENPPEDVPLPDSFYYGDEGIEVEQPENFIDDPPKPLIDASGCIIPEEFDGQTLFHLPVENDTDLKIVKHEFIGESSNFIDSEDIDYLIDEAFLDPTINPPIDDVAFLETNDLSNPIEYNNSNFDKVEDYLNFFDTDEGNSFYDDLYSSTIMGSENLATPLFEQDVDGGAFQENVESELVLQGQNENLASTSNQEPSYYESAKDKNFSDIKYPSYLKQGSCMQPSFASEYPSKKGLSLGASHSSSPIHVTAGMMFIRNISVTGDGTYWAPGKNLEVNIVLSQINEEDCGSLSTKSVYALSRMWYYLMILVWVMILPLSFQLGSCLYTRKAL